MGNENIDASISKTPAAVLSVINDPINPKAIGTIEIGSIKGE